MGKVLSGELSCPCDRSCFIPHLSRIAQYEIFGTKVCGIGKIGIRSVLQLELIVHVLSRLYMLACVCTV